MSWLQAFHFALSWDHDCNNRTELEDLKESLTKLKTEFGLPLEQAIERVQSSIEGRDDDSPDDDHYDYRGPSAPSGAHEPANDEEIKNLFNTLIE